MKTKIKFGENIHGVRFYSCPSCDRGSLFAGFKKPKNLVKCIVCDSKFDLNSNNIELIEEHTRDEVIKARNEKSKII